MRARRGLYLGLSVALFATLLSFGQAAGAGGVVRSTVVGAVLRGGWTSPRLDDASLHATSSEASPTPVAIITTERFIGLF